MENNYNIDDTYNDLSDDFNKMNLNESKNDVKYVPMPFVFVNPNNVNNETDDETDDDEEGLFNPLCHDNAASYVKFPQKYCDCYLDEYFHLLESLHIIENEEQLRMKLEEDLSNATPEIRDAYFSIITNENIRDMNQHAKDFLFNILCNLVEEDPKYTFNRYLKIRNITDEYIMLVCSLLEDKNLLDHSWNYTSSFCKYDNIVELNKVFFQSNE